MHIKVLNNKQNVIYKVNIIILYCSLILAAVIILILSELSVIIITNIYNSTLKHL